jgi:2-amino-4-hydroxy-6-hydroxymethyldihydropteridine diphosphokinase
VKPPYVKKTVYLSLGSNIGDRAANLKQATERLQDVGTVVAASSLYETDPVEVEQQPMFLNCALAMETELTPWQFLSQILALEQSMGRRRTQLKGPRTIDIDIVFFGDAVIDTSDLTVPHPAMHQRRFVLEPMAEIAPDAIHPVFKSYVRELLSALPQDAGKVRRYEEPAASS